MLTRTAIYEGRVAAGREEEFFRLVGEKLDPIWRQFPHVRAVRVQRTLDRDDETPPIAMIMEMDFPDRAAMRESLASPIRESAHAATLEVMRLFEGRFYHLVAEADTFGPADGDYSGSAASGG
jgi:hypothetical protein